MDEIEKQEPMPQGRPTIFFLFLGGLGFIAALLGADLSWRPASDFCTDARRARNFRTQLPPFVRVFVEAA
jgi:hypothetical protein